MLDSFLTWRHERAIDAHWPGWLLALSGCFVNGVRDLYAFGYSAKRRKLSIQMVAIPNEYEEMRGRTVCLFRPRHRDDATHMLDQARLVGKFSRHSLCQIKAPLFTGREIPSLDDEVFHRAAKGCRVECAGGGQIEKVAHTLRRDFGNHFDLNRARFSFKSDALRGHLLYRRSVKRFGRIYSCFRGPGVGLLRCVGLRRSGFRLLRAGRNAKRGNTNQREHENQRVSGEPRMIRRKLSMTSCRFHRCLVRTGASATEQDFGSKRQRRE